MMDPIVSETLLNLVSLYSPSGEEKQAVEYLVERMQFLKFDTAFQDPAGNAVGIMGQGSRQLVLLGHIDTVPGELDVRVEHGVLHGRGTVDAKGPLAAFVDAVAAVGLMPGWQVVVIGAVGEEKDSEGARYIVDQYNPDYVIIGEPSRWNRITLGYKGSAWAEIVVKKRQSHSAGKGSSASEVAFNVWQDIQNWTEEFNSDREKLFDQLLISLRRIYSDDNGFEEWAGLHVGGRLPVGMSPEEYYRRLQDVVTGAEFTAIGFPVSAYRAEKNTPLVKAFLAAIRAANSKPRFVVKTGTSDMNIVAPVWQCPTLAYGPGDSDLDHTPEEHVSLVEYDRAVNILEHVLHQVCEK